MIRGQFQATVIPPTSTVWFKANFVSCQAIKWSQAIVGSPLEFTGAVMNPNTSNNIKGIKKEEPGQNFSPIISPNT